MTKTAVLSKSPGVQFATRRDGCTVWATTGNVSHSLGLERFYQSRLLQWHAVSVTQLAIITLSPRKHLTNTVIFIILSLIWNVIYLPTIACIKTKTQFSSSMNFWYHSLRVNSISHHSSLMSNIISLYYKSYLWKVYLTTRYRYPAAWWTKWV